MDMYGLIFNYTYPQRLRGGGGNIAAEVIPLSHLMGSGDIQSELTL